MTTEIDAEGLEAARYAVRFALMSGEVGTMGAAEIAIRAYLASTSASEAEPVAKSHWLSSFTVDNCNHAALDSAVGVLRTGMASGSCG